MFFYKLRAGHSSLFNFKMCGNARHSSAREYLAASFENLICSYEHFTFMNSFKDIIHDLDAMAAQRIKDFCTMHADEYQVEDSDEKKALTFEKFMAEHGENGLKTFTGLSKAQFEEILHVVEEKLIPTGRGRRKQFLPIDQLFLTLTWIQSGWTYSKLSVVFSISFSKVQRILIDTVLSIADTMYNHFIVRKVARDEGERKFQHFPEAVGACDVALLFVNKPRGNDTQKQFYSAKHKMHGIKLQAIVNPDGLCIHTDIKQLGHVHDKKVFDVSDALNLVTFEELLPNMTKVKKHYPLLFDKGYTGVNRYYPEAIVTQRKPIGRDLTSQENKFNHDVESDRVIVENFFGRMRAKCGILSMKFRSDRDVLPLVAKICISLTNISTRDQPLRANELASTNEYSEEEEE